MPQKSKRRNVKCTKRQHTRKHSHRQRQHQLQRGGIVFDPTDEQTFGFDEQFVDPNFKESPLVIVPTGIDVQFVNNQLSDKERKLIEIDMVPYKEIWAMYSTRENRQTWTTAEKITFAAIMELIGTCATTKNIVTNFWTKGQLSPQEYVDKFVSAEIYPYNSMAALVNAKEFGVYFPMALPHEIFDQLKSQQLHGQPLVDYLLNEQNQDLFIINTVPAQVSAKQLGPFATFTRRIQSVFTSQRATSTNVPKPFRFIFVENGATHNIKAFEEGDYKDMVLNCILKFKNVNNLILFGGQMLDNLGNCFNPTTPQKTMALNQYCTLATNTCQGPCSLSGTGTCELHPSAQTTVALPGMHAQHSNA